MQFDIIIVLAGGITRDGGLPESVQNRVELAYQLYQQQRALKVLFSGRWSANWDHVPPQHTEAWQMREYARELGLPARALLLEEHSQNTMENALYTTKLFLEPNGWIRVGVITSDFHVPRVRRVFAKILGDEYSFEVFGAKTSVGVLKSLRWQAKEVLVLGAERFVEHITKRR